MCKLKVNMLKQKSYKNFSAAQKPLFFPVSKKSLIQLALFIVLTMGLHFSSMACSPLAVPPLISQTITGNQLLLDWQSINTQQGTCTYSVEVEIMCMNAQFTGVGPFFLSPLLTKTATPQAYPQQTVNLSQFCPGQVYQFRARERDPGGLSSGWTAIFTFTVPGVYVAPVLNVLATNTILCPPTQTAMLTAQMNSACATPYSYTWTPALGLSSTTSFSTIATPSTTTNYSVTVSGAGLYSCWTLTGSILVIAEAPTFTINNITGSQSITCTYPTIDLEAVHNYTYNPLTYFWSSNSFTANTQSVTITSPGTYTATLKDPITNCVKTQTYTVFLNNTPPTSSVAPITQSVGCGAGVVATATGVALSPTTNVTHNWYSPGLQTPQSSGGQTSIYLAPIQGPVTTSTFELCNNINGCCTSKTIQVISTGGSYPTFNLSSSQNFSIGCTSRSLTTINIVNPQSGSGGVVSFTLLAPGFSGPGYTTNAQSTFTVSTPGPYTVIVRDNANNCETRFPVSIIQNTFAPNISSSAISRTLSCAVPSMVLNGVSSNTPAVPIDFSWSFQNGSNPNVINNYSLVVNTQAPFTNSVINTYTLTITDQNNACKNNTVVTMWQNTRPPIAAISPSLSSLTCATGSINMSNNSVTGIINFPIAYPLVGLLWEGPTPQVPKTNSSSYLAFVPGTYTMEVIDMNNGCKAKATATVVDEKDYPVLKGDTLVALDCGAQTKGVALTVTVVGMPSSAVTATWYPPVPTPSTSTIYSLNLNTNGVGLYHLVVQTTSNQCISQHAVKVVNGALTATFTPDQTTGYAPLTVNFTNNSSSTNSVTGTQSITSVWSYGNGTTKTTTTNINTSALYTAPGTYSVTMFASKGLCLDTAQVIIVVDIPSKLEVPNVFTPNGDGANDMFFVRSANLTNITAQIFDRWGNKIYELNTDKGNIAWDGKNQQGKEVPDGTYFYTIKATGKDGQGYDTKGTVSLYR
jgi:gliding motility-associated-like protein